MKSFYVIITVALLSAFSTDAQIAIDWQQCFGGTLDDISYDLKQMPDGGYVMVGTTFSQNGDVSGNHGQTDIWLARTDAFGNLLWQKCLGGTLEEFGNSVQLTTDGGFIICGSAESNNFDASLNHGLKDLWLVKTDSLGNIEWQKSYGGTNNETGNKVILTNDGGYAVAGKTGSSNNGDVSGYHASTDFWLLKTDSIGTLLWQKCLGGSDYEEAFDLIQTIDSGFIISGYTMSSDFDVTDTILQTDGWMVKTDSVGNILWNHTLGGYGYHELSQMIATSDGGYMMIGNKISQFLNSAPFYEFYVVKTNSIGITEWSKTYGGNKDDYGFSLLELADGNFMIGGFTKSTDGDAIGNLFNNNRSAWLIKINNVGTIIYQQTFGGSSDDDITSVILNGEGGITILGTTYSIDGDVDGNHGLRDMWLVKLTEQYNLINGKLFFDSNLNNIQDIGESGISNVKVNELNTGRFDFTDISGNYSLIVTDTGNFEISPDQINFCNNFPVLHTAYFDSSAVTDTLNDFALQPTGNFNDLCVSITPVGNFRSGMNGYYVINYKNYGTTTLSPTIIFYPDPNLTFVSSSPAPSSIAPDSIVWVAGSLTPFQEGTILIKVDIMQGLIIGTLINSSAFINPVVNDVNPGCNQSYWEIFITGSYDPNDILVSRDTLFTSELITPDYLDYIIRFQNTGNDTAFTVKVVNKISTDLDLSSFQIVGSSHNMNPAFIGNDRKMEFIFSDILLPDSSVNEADSHGFVRYRIKPTTTLVAGDTIKNQADIYFDFNMPVLTNIATTEIVMPVGVSETIQYFINIKVYPNPANDNMHLEIMGVSNQYIEVSMYTIFGQLIENIYKGRVHGDKMELSKDLKNVSNGIYFIKIASQAGEANLKLIKY